MRERKERKEERKIVFDREKKDNEFFYFDDLKKEHRHHQIVPGILNIELASSNTALADEASGAEARSIAVVVVAIDAVELAIIADDVSATIVAASWKALVLILVPRAEERGRASARNREEPAKRA